VKLRIKGIASRQKYGRHLTANTKGAEEILTRNFVAKKFGFILSRALESAHSSWACNANVALKLCRFEGAMKWPNW